MNFGYILFVLTVGRLWGPSEVSHTVLAELWACGQSQAHWTASLDHGLQQSGPRQKNS